jgi:hypothetical protein
MRGDLDAMVSAAITETVICCASSGYDAGEIGMTKDAKKEPLEGLHITDYNKKNEIVTIELHRYLIKNPNSIKAIQKRIVDIIKHGPNVSGVEVKSRKK